MKKQRQHASFGSVVQSVPLLTLLHSGTLGVIEVSG